MKQIMGKGVVDGVCLASVMTLSEDIEGVLDRYAVSTIEDEKSAYQQASQAAVGQIEELIKNATDQTQADVLNAHLLMITDVMLTDSIEAKISGGLSAPRAVMDAANEMAAMLGAIEDEYLKERSKDVIDIGKRMVRIMLGISAPDIAVGYHVLCGDDIEPSMVANMTSEHVGAIILGQGSTTSHAVIIAKTKGIPTVVGLGNHIDAIENGETVYVDGETGEIIISPDETVKVRYQERVAAIKAMAKQYDAIVDQPSVLKDGMHLPLAINVGNPTDIDSMKANGAEGVGLYRTEFVFMGKAKAPDEDEQFEAYRYVVERAKPHLCVIRTLDIGGDKPADYLEIGEEANPFLGWRAIRICLDKPELFKTQIRAILRASHYGKAAIMLPMIISESEVLDSKALIDEAKAELRTAGMPFDEAIEVGIMIETPAAVMQAERLAKVVDFFSVGTNDLTQYTLAVDRGNPKISDRYDYFHPSVLYAINMVAAAAHANGIWIGMCGEMAGDPLALPVLLAMGFDELSMSAPSVLKVKYLMKSLKVDSVLLDDVLASRSAVDTRARLTHYLEKIKLKEEIHEKDY
ncbi:phosphoenolpyruvate--protein phosphotransferase [Fusibacter paucivorans]|uniref:Phosphoenolpyruvate-protein phosphotransferase n=1 Tax=Fusibacter paucivorans TaxID=76009 RepID=A0ABS5PN34_9FIRM|nr:phosphoenolpyruvate--protein phosphotransferase [Fusibacter paucivorans]MBS7525976.1 phosphoenolpyruvate--protein phosphotransferase [Fusibacter paucivorans]